MPLPAPWPGNGKYGPIG
uniref:Uncharacterized protein n=1 Tax=Arundo donax TaxID=35708 RepID=A0A0A9HH34_ARUDO